MPVSCIMLILIYDLCIVQNILPLSVEKLNYFAVILLFFDIEFQTLHHKIIYVKPVSHGYYSHQIILTQCVT